MTAHQATWWYAVVPAAAANEAVGIASGISGQPARLVVEAPVAAVVGSVELPADGSLQQRLRDPRWLTDAARRHHAVVATYASACPTVPLRLATVHRDDGRVRDALRRHRAALSAALEVVAGRQEWGVQAYPAGPDPATAGAPPAAATPVPVAASGHARGVGPAGAPPVSGHRQDARPAETASTATGTTQPGTAYLQRRRAERVARENARRRSGDAVAQVYGCLAGLAVASVRHPGTAQIPGRERPVMNASFLVDRARAEHLTELVRQLEQAQPSLRLRVTGPWPAYSFVDLDVETA